MNNLISKASVCEILADIYPTDGEKVVAVKEVDKAYEAIQQLPSAQPEIEERMSETEQNVPNDDFISRKGAIDAIEAVFPVDPMKSEYAQGIACGAALSKTYIEQLPSAQPEPHWRPCSEKLPDNRVSVLVCFREWQQYAKRYIYSIVTGWYARKHSVRENVFSEWEADCDYDEDEDEFYIHEGWYEFTTQGNADLMNWYIGAEIVAWMPLPDPWKGESDANNNSQN